MMRISSVDDVCVRESIHPSILLDVEKAAVGAINQGTELMDIMISDGTWAFIESRKRSETNSIPFPALHKSSHTLAEYLYVLTHHPSCMHGDLPHRGREGRKNESLNSMAHRNLNQVNNCTHHRFRSTTVDKARRLRRPNCINLHFCHNSTTVRATQHSTVSPPSAASSKDGRFPSYPRLPPPLAPLPHLLLPPNLAFPFPFPKKHKHLIKGPIKTVVILVMENRWCLLQDGMGFF